MTAVAVNTATLARWQQELRQASAAFERQRDPRSIIERIVAELDDAMTQSSHTTLDSVFVALKGAQTTLQEIHDLAKQVSPRDERGAWIAAKAANLFQLMDHWAVLWRGAR